MNAIDIELALLLLEKYRKDIIMKLKHIAVASLIFYGCDLFAASPIEPIMVTIPKGSFEMGDADNERAKPVHKVSLQEFSLGKYEVTIKEFRQFIEATGYAMPTGCYHQLNGWFSFGETEGNWQNNSLNSRELQPVNCIGWKAAKAYTQWLAKETGRPYRLPSEAEWEYAARAGTTTKFYFGDDQEQTEVCQYENTADLYGENILQRDSNTSYVNFANGKSNCSDNSAYASIVGMYKPNQFGLHDMLSNVVEFVEDCYQENYQNAPSDGKAIFKEKCERHVARGGSWHWNVFEVSRRMGFTDDFIGGMEGFRIALDGSAPKQSESTKRFAEELESAQKFEQIKRDSIPKFPKIVTNLELSQENGVVTLTWDKSDEENIQGYRVYRNGGVGRLFKLLAANVFDNSFKDANADIHQYEYTVVAVRNHLQSDYSNFVKTQVANSVIPGRIEAEAAAEIEGAGISRTSDSDGKFNLSGREGIANEASLQYHLDVAKSGTYELSYRVATPRDTKGFTLLINGKEMLTSNVSKTGGYHDWQTQIGKTVKLKKGKNILTLKSLDNNWKLNWLELKLK